jgi:alpha-beta hydrolase superfamily lysophospholipase
MLKRASIAIGVLLALGSAGVLVFERVGAYAIVDAPNRERRVPPAEPGELRIPVGPPAATLSVTVVEPAAPPRAVVMLLHGIRSQKESLRDVAQHLAGAGYRAVLVDSRGQGRSTGEWLTYGVQESGDLSQLLDSLRVPASMPIGVLGASYGAATAIEWAGRDPRVRAVVALAPFSSLREIVPEYMRRTLPVIGRLLPRALVQATVNKAARLAQFDPDKASPLQAIAASEAPVLIFHGSADTHIPPAHSRALAARSPEHTTVVLLDGQDHNGIAGDPRLWPAVLDFFDRSFRK